MNKQKSFTLIELLVVIVIIGILAGVIMISTSSSIDKANIAKIKVFEESVQNNLAANMVSAWDADHVTKTEAGNWTLNDKWGNNHGTFHNGTGIVCSSTSGSEACPQIVNDKQMGNVLSFDGVDDYIDCGNKSDLNITDSITISMWVNPKTLPISDGTQQTLYTRSNVHSLLLLNYVNGKIYALQSNGSGWTNLAITNSQFLFVNKWTNIVFSYNNIFGELRIFANGVNVVNGGSTSSKITSSAPTVLGARKGGSYSFDGLMNDVRIYNAALSSSQIKQNYIADLDSLLSKELISKEEYNARIEALSQK